MKPHVRFEEEADAEYHLAGRWYEDHRQHLGIEFFDAVDATIDQIVLLPDAGSWWRASLQMFRCDDVRCRASRFTSSIFRREMRSGSWPSPTIGESPDIGRVV